MAEYVRRDGYLSLLHECKDAVGVVKVITGMRRCGKSTLLDQFAEDLRNDGVDEDHIFHMNFESFEGQETVSDDELRAMLRSLPNDRISYVLLDEVQDVDGWEMIVAALEAEKRFDVYITGSNSDMLSTDLATHLSGRYIEIKVLPLSFKEYLQLHPGDRESRFDQYLRYGGLPDSDPDRGERFCRGYLEGVFNTILVKDVLSRLKTDDVGRIGTIARFLYSNIGNVTNRSAISKGTGLNQATVDRYVEGMEDALLFHHADRYDIVGKRLLSTNGKYYASDMGMRNTAISGKGVQDLGRTIENVVYLELIRRGYDVRTGSYRDKEVDFSAVKGDETEYFQVTETMLAEDTRGREMHPLRSIRDSFPKTVLTLDRFGLGNYEGIKAINIIDWLLE